jgi:steroid 5-alpha reductase family enzyme
MSSEIWSLLGINLAMMVVALSVVAIPSFRTRDPSYIDGVWGLGFLVVAVSSFVQTNGDPIRKSALLGLCALWGFRLAGYLLWRWRKNGPDPRYQTMLGAKRHGSDAFFLWTRVFLAQAVILTVVSLPVQLGQVYNHPKGLSSVNVIGVGLALFGIVFEAIADAQLARFKSDQSSHGQVMDNGLWAYSRHPNYFGEACVWWGLFLVAVVNIPTAFAAAGPLVITCFLLKWSGVGHLERSLKQSKPEYINYIATTSGFVPLPKRSRRARQQGELEPDHTRGHGASPSSAP